MSAKKLTKAGLRRVIRNMAAELADAIVDLVEEQGLSGELEPESEDDLGEPRVRRSQADLEDWMNRIVAELHRIDEPIAIGRVAERLGTTSRKIAHPMALLVEQGKVARQGERRGARYQIASNRKKRARATGRRSVRPPDKKKR